MKFQKGQPKSGGRQRGTQNRTTAAIKEFAAKVLEDEAYRAALIDRIRRGKAQEIEKLLYFYAYGKPKESVEVTGRDAKPEKSVVVYIPDNGRQGNANNQS